MKFVFVLLAGSMLLGIDAAGRGRMKYRRQMPFPGQPEVTEEPWPHVDLQKVDRRQDSWQEKTATSGLENLDDTVVVGDLQVPVPDSPNSSRQFYPGWIQPSAEVPKPISPVTNPPAQSPSYPAQQPPYQNPSEQPNYQIPPNGAQPPQANPVPPPGCLGPRGQYPSLNNCANYLNCWDDVVIEQTCPNGLLFNDVTGLCDFDYNVNCGSRPGATPKPPLPAGSKRCPDLNGRYRSATNCSEFYVCLSGSPIKFNCPPGLVYNDAVSVCDYLYNVDCQGAATPPPMPLPAPESTWPTASGAERPTQPQQTQRPQPTFPPGAYPDNSWLGRSGEPDPWHQRPVGAQLELDMKQDAANGNNSGEAVESDPTVTPTIQSPWDLVHSIPEELTKGPCENGNVHRLDESCASVVVCRNKRPQLVQCPQGFTYDRPSDSCRHFNIAKC
ncbi:uncharacterized protein [Venturia canescens]|uniref:uncharacterized protein n=1 Tax=Venturia canescens TaxID=32260 RepID=UPI001C9CDDB5|nr:uncharacterized protein LOC122410803 [Venturia canescens]